MWEMVDLLQIHGSSISQRVGMHPSRPRRRASRRSSVFIDHTMHSISPPPREGSKLMPELDDFHAFLNQVEVSLQPWQMNGPSADAREPFCAVANRRLLEPSLAPIST